MPLRGIVVYNGFWNSRAVPDPVIRLVKAAENKQVVLTPIANTLLIAEMGKSVSVRGAEQADFVLFWDKDIRLANALQQMGLPVWNRPAAIALCDDKSATHLMLAGQGIPMPKTLVAPMTYTAVTPPIVHFLDESEKCLGYPMIVKECFGSLGGQVYMAENREQLDALAYNMGAKPFLTQQFVAAERGQDVRLYVIGGNVAAAIRRKSLTDFRANIGQGATAESYTPTEEECRLAIRCCSILGLLFGGVDILHDDHGDPLVCEVNSNAHMAGITQSTGVDIASLILDEVLKEMKLHTV